MTKKNTRYENVSILYLLHPDNPEYLVRFLLDTFLHLVAATRKRERVTLNNLASKQIYHTFFCHYVASTFFRNGDRQSLE